MKNKKKNSPATTVASIIIAAIILGGVFGMTYYMSNNDPDFAIGEDKITITAFASQTLEFSIDDIESVELINTMPSGRRNFGVGTSKLYRGRFTFEGYGSSRAYIHRLNAPYLVILMDDLAVFFNYKESDKTVELYDILLTLISE